MAKSNPDALKALMKNDPELAAQIAQDNPEYFGLSEDMRRAAGVKKGDTIDYADLMRLHGRATEMKKSKNRAIRERGVKMARQVTWFKNFHKRKSESVGYE